MSSYQKQSPFFYGWIIAICGTVILGLTQGVVSNCFSLYIIPVSAALNITRDAFSLCFTIINAIYAVISFTSGWIYSKIRIQTTMKVSAITLPLGYFAFSLCRSAAAFYVCSAVVGISLSFLTFIPFTAIISNWFYEKRGTALGICFMGSGLGGMVMNSLIALLLKYQGWETAYRVPGLIMLLVLVLSVFFIIRVTPEEKGLSPLGLPSGDHERIYGVTAGEAMRSPSFFALLGLALIIGLTSSIIGTVITPHLCDLGYGTLFASNVMSVYLGFVALAKILLGKVYDRFGALRGTAVSMFGFLVGFLGLFLSRSIWFLPLIMFATFGTASSNLSYPVTTRFAFGTRNYQKLFGYMIGTNFITGSVGAVLANRLYTIYGTYNPAIFLSMALAVLALALLPIVKPARG